MWKIAIDKLPENFQEVIVCTTKETAFGEPIKDSYFATYYEGNGFICKCFHNFIENVTHWKPVPELP